MSDAILNQAAQAAVQSAPDSPPASEAPKGGEWVDQLTPDLKDIPEIKAYKEKGIKVSEFVKQSLEAKRISDEMTKKLQGAILPLGDKATPEEIAAYQKALGVPDSEEGYDFKGIDSPIKDENLEKQMKVIMKKAGIPAASAKEFYKGYSELAKTLSNDIAQKTQERKAACEAELQKEWGKDFEKKNSAFEAAVKNGLTKEDVDILNSSGLINSPSIRKVLASAGKAYTESGFVTGRTQAPSKGGYSEEFYQRAEAAKR